MTPRRGPGPAFAVALPVGAAVMAFGLWGLWANAGRTHPADFARWFVGAALAHDLVVAPVVLGVGAMLTRVVHGRVRAAVQAALAITAVLVVTTFPFWRGYGRAGGNPTVLPLDYARGLVIVCGAVWAGAALWALGGRRRAQRIVREGGHPVVEGHRGPEPEDGGGPRR